MLHFFVVHQFIESEVVQNEKECQTRENILIFFLQKVMAPSETDHNEIRPEMVKKKLLFLHDVRMCGSCRNNASRFFQGIVLLDFYNFLNQKILTGKKNLDK
jgi:hypothetical protein